MIKNMNDPDENNMNGIKWKIKQLMEKWKKLWEYFVKKQRVWRSDCKNKIWKSRFKVCSRCTGISLDFLWWLRDIAVYSL